MDIVEVIAFAIKNRAADIHLVPDLPPQMTFGGELRRINVPPLSVAQIADLMAAQLSPEVIHELRVGRDGTFRFEIDRLGAITGRFNAGTVVLLMPDREALQAARSAAAPESAPGAPRAGGIPAIFVSLALLGLVLAGAGFAKLALHMDLLPEPWRFDNDGFVLIVAGIALMLPAAVRKFSGKQSS
jgi:hypothetical protein